MDIDPDVLAATKEMARRTKRTAGQVLSDLARQTLAAEQPPSSPAAVVVHGFEVIPANDRVVSAEFVQKLIEESEQP